VETKQRIEIAKNDVSNITNNGGNVCIELSCGSLIYLDKEVARKVANSMQNTGDIADLKKAIFCLR